MSFATHDWDIWSEGQRNPTYEQWASGGGPDECEHGVQRGLPCDGCTRILASEQVWRLPSEWNDWQSAVDWSAHASGEGCDEPPRIATRNDIFAPFSGKWVTERGHDPQFPEPRDWFCGKSEIGRPLETADVIARYFATVDACPNCEFVAVTEHPELVRGLIWPTVRNVRLNEREEYEAVRKNLSLAIKASTQAELEARLPEACDLVGNIYLWLSPTRPMDLRRIPIGGASSPFDGVIIDNLPHTDIYPLIGQCREAGMDHWIEEPKSTHTAKYTDPSEKLSPTAQNYLRQLREGAE